jgi:ABC-type nickel/cobalt efflux system permease component RcnA
MRRFVVLLVVFVCIGPAIGTVWSHNPFTSKPETHDNAPEPLCKSRLFVKIALLQQQLKQEMSELVRIAQTDGCSRPQVMLMGLAFIYGAIHAVGPGHGKFVATSYILSHRVSITGGVLLGLCIATLHGFTGAIGVLALR